eukprot:scaffold1058_cov155-Ochromonas_danica.AAC.14
MLQYHLQHSTLCTLREITTSPPPPPPPAPSWRLLPVFIAHRRYRLLTATRCGRPLAHLELVVVDDSFDQEEEGVVAGGGGGGEVVRLSLWGQRVADRLQYLLHPSALLLLLHPALRRHPRHGLSLQGEVVAVSPAGLPDELLWLVSGVAGGGGAGGGERLQQRLVDLLRWASRDTQITLTRERIFSQAPRRDCLRAVAAAAGGGGGGYPLFHLRHALLLLLRIATPSHGLWAEAEARDREGVSFHLIAYGQDCVDTLRRLAAGGGGGGGEVEEVELRWAAVDCAYQGTIKRLALRSFSQILPTQPPCYPSSSSSSSSSTVCCYRSWSDLLREIASDCSALSEERRLVCCSLRKVLFAAPEVTHCLAMQREGGGGAGAGGGGKLWVGYRPARFFFGPPKRPFPLMEIAHHLLSTTRTEQEEEEEEEEEEEVWANAIVNAVCGQQIHTPTTPTAEEEDSDEDEGGGGSGNSCWLAVVVEDEMQRRLFGEIPAELVALALHRRTTTAAPPTTTTTRRWRCDYADLCQRVMAGCEESARQRSTCLASLRFQQIVAHGETVQKGWRILLDGIYGLNQTTSNTSTSLLSCSSASSHPTR